MVRRREARRRSDLAQAAPPLGTRTRPTRGDLHNPGTERALGTRLPDRSRRVRADRFLRRHKPGYPAPPQQATACAGPRACSLHPKPPAAITRWRSWPWSPDLPRSPRPSPNCVTLSSAPPRQPALATRPNTCAQPEPRTPSGRARQHDGIQHPASRRPGLLSELLTCAEPDRRYRRSAPCRERIGLPDPSASESGMAWRRIWGFG